MNRRTIRFAVIFMGLALPVATGQADDVWVRGILYSRVTFLGVTDGVLKFSFQDQTLSKPLDDITRVQLSGNDEFNKAEDHLAEGRFDEANAAYAEGVRKATLQTLDLVAHRQGLAKARKKPEASKPSAPAAPPRCYYCAKSGLMACPDCRVLGKSTGKTVCADCKVKGSITCPDCDGAWGHECGYCDGSGKEQTGTRTEGMFVRPLFSPCYHCDGRGYVGPKWPYDPCARCFNQAPNLRGTVKCPACGGSGLNGECPSCGGKMKVPCTYCEDGKLQGAARQEPRPAPAPGAAPPAALPARPTLPAPSSDPLFSPEDLALTLSKRPVAPSSQAGWAGMTSLQREQADQEHRQALAEHDRKRLKYLSKPVVWTLVVDDVAKSPNGTDYVLTAVSSSGHKITASVAAENKDALLKLRKNDPVIVAGAIKDCSIGGGAGLSPSSLTVLLDGASVRETADPRLVNFFALTAVADDVVYVVDRSGSMLDTFGQVRTEVVRSLGRLNDKQDFQVLFVGQPAGEGLTKATAQGKAAVEKTVVNALAGGPGDPLPALEQALKVLSGHTGKNKVILLVSNGAVADSQGLLNTLKRLHTDKQARIFTCLVGQPSREAEALMTQIADQHGGRCSLSSVAETSR